jgi:hypothetical protein
MRQESELQIESSMIDQEVAGFLGAESLISRARIEKNRTPLSGAL